MKLTIGDFTRSGPVGSFGHVFTHKLEDGGEICLESCMEGYCVGRYDKDLQLIGEKKCTEMPEVFENQIMQGFSTSTGDALMKAISIANTLI